MPRIQAVLIWLALAALVTVPAGFAVASPLLEWRSAVYIMAGLAGVIGMALILLQPVLAAGLLPGISLSAGRQAHRWVGATLLIAVIVHVAGLWLTSPPDVVDALLFASPTPFSVWGVIAMWALFAVALLVALRKRLKWRPQLWRALHTGLVGVVAAGTVAHALLIVGTMETISKTLLGAAVVAVLALAITRRKVWRGLIRR